jgi:hypothetical protein
MNTSGQENWMDKLFHKKLANLEIMPEDHVWEGIVKRLNEDKKRPALFGSWWTVLLSIIMLLLVTGVGAYMLYKRNYQQKTDRKPNKDLPYLQPNDKEAGTAFQFNSGIRALSSTPHPASYYSDEKTGNSTKSKSLYKLDANQIMDVGSGETMPYTNGPEMPVNADPEMTQQTLSNIQSENNLSANDLLASADHSFIPVSQVAMTTYSYLPLLESVLTKENRKLSSPSLMDGCNVYKSNKSHFFIDIYYAPEIASRSLSTDDPALQAYVDERFNSEKPMLSYSAGIKGSVVFGNGLTARVGLSYSNNSERFDFIKERQKITKEIKDQNGNVIRTEITELVITDKVYNSYKFIDLPIMIGYEKDLKDFILSVNGGIGLNLSASQSGKIYKEDIKSVYILEDNGEANAPIFKKSAGMSLIGSIGLNYKYNERIMLLLEPSARYYIHSLSEASNPVSQRYLFLGMNVGLRYRIK